MPVPTTPDMSSHDLRSRAIDAKRFHDKKAKWAHGAAERPSGKVNAEGEAFHRPMSQHTAATWGKCTCCYPTIRPNSRKLHQRSLVDLESGSQHDTSLAEREYIGPNHISTPTADVMYSFDAPGPQHGSRILATAVEKAVERFETRETERLVKNEYEVVREEPKEREHVEDDGFELI